jgi:parallel beta-helix repeat protein
MVTSLVCEVHQGADLCKICVVRIHNARTHSQLKGNIIHGSTGAGVVVSLSATPLISNNDICNHQLDGLVIATAAAPTVIGNRIYGTHSHKCSLLRLDTVNLLGTEVFENLWQAAKRPASSHTARGSA